ncbi:MAG: cupin domain-containing protein [Acutalibacter sp.]
MIEQTFSLTQGNQKTVEKVLMDENIHYFHMIFNKGEGMPEHFANAKNIYMTVIRGLLSIGLNEQETHEYPAGTMLKIPFNTKMNVRNFHDDILELIVVKAPSPQTK